MNGIQCQRQIVNYCNCCTNKHNQFSHFINIYKEGTGIKFKALITCIICGSLVYTWSSWEANSNPNIDIQKCEMSYNFDTYTKSTNII